MKDYYKILQVNKSASPEIIAKVYKILAKKYHPDANLDNKQEAEEKFKEISEAYEILSNEEKRKNYDLELEEQENKNINNTVSMEDFINLSNYCKELENTINKYSTNTSNTVNHSNTYYEQNQFNQAQRQAEEKAYYDAVNKAYHDSYINNLKNMGYKIRYKKTFKQKLKNLLALIITFAILFVVFYILWHIPYTQEKIKSFFLFPLFPIQ